MTVYPDTSANVVRTQVSNDEIDRKQVCREAGYYFDNRNSVATYECLCHSTEEYPSS